MAWTKAKTAIAVGIGIIVATGTATVVVKGMSSSKPVHPAAGELPETLAELNAWYVEPPAGQNAAAFVMQGVKAMQTADAGQNTNLPVFGNLPPDAWAPLPPTVKSELASFLQDNQDALQFFAQGAQYDQGRYPVDFTTDPGLPYLQGVDNAGKLCEMAAILDAANGDGKKAGDDVATALALARSLQAEPVLISQLVRNADIVFAVAALNQSVNRTTLPPESLSALAKMFQDMEEYDVRGEGFYRALVGEKVMHLSMLNDRKELLGSLKTPGSAGQPATERERRRLIDYVNKNADLHAEQDYVESSIQQLMSACRDTFPDRVKHFEDLVQERTSDAQNQGLLLSADYLPGFTHVGGREARGVAGLRLAMTAIALEQFRASHGNRYPDGLSELVPSYLDAPLMDPFDGNPLRYRKQGTGYVLYSIGPELKDDGGDRTKGRDLVFAVVRPPAY